MSKDIILMSKELDNKVMSISLLCDLQGYITDLLCDELGLANTVKVGQHFIEAFDRETQEKAKNFLAELKTKNLSFDWPLTMKMDDKRLSLLHFSGGVNNDALFIVGTQTPASINQFFDELMKINNEQTNTLREVVKEQVKAQQKTFQKTPPNQQDSHLYEELSQVNNELANTQRELTKKNAQLEQQRKKLETLNIQLTNTIEELQRTRHELLQSEKMAALGHLVTGVAHEINTPVGVGVTAATQLDSLTFDFVKRYKEGKMTRRDLEQYLNAVHHTNNLILKNLTRAAELTKSFKSVAVDQASEELRTFMLHDYLSEILTSLKPKLKNMSYQITVDCDPNLQLTTYPGAFSQIITHFIMNSLQHGFAGCEQGNIHITAQPEGERLQLHYSDDGKGMAADIITKIFEPFFTTDRAEGSGLGMHIVYNLVTHKLKGSIHCESELGNGVWFTIKIPLSMAT